MEKEQRSKLQKATQEARRLLEEEFSRQLLETYDINVAAGHWHDEPGTHLQAEQRLLREKLLAWVEHRSAQINDEKEALLLALREMAFTALNRFVALKLMEARELVRPCVSGGLESEGFQEFTAVAQGLLVEQESSYRLYLETIFEDVSRELRALFDPRDPASLLWPKRTALLDLLDILNRPELAELWREDETLGWIYQYFNGDAERKKMREESSAPRNSRELAVRNQFFTPRYVVEFLTDNTLGRIWYEMRQGQTGLKDRCRYLVRRPNEIWLQPGDEPPAEVVADETLSQEELLKQPVHIPHRPLKDPREIRMLDPACGSMHFGLYAFDLYLEIYEEAWKIAQGSDKQAQQGEAFDSFVAYAVNFANKAAFLREMPRLILQHNIHGIDIDPRATQIARLTLWLRAQRAWQEQGVEVAARPAITRSNVVCAEPMPGERELLADFVDQQFPEAERGLVQQLLETIFDKMQLAGEAGSLLKIEEEIRDAIDQARREWQKLAIQQRDLFSAAELAALGGVGSSLNGDLQSLAKDFWIDIEDRIYVALEEYADQAETGGGFQRRLFADDAAQGFAFIDICRKRYEVSVMNPPFGHGAPLAKAYQDKEYPSSKNDLYCGFVERMICLSAKACFVGSITSRTAFFLSSMRPWREQILLEKTSIRLFADLGWGVLDGAGVETAAFVVQSSNLNGAETSFYRINEEADKQAFLREAISKGNEYLLRSEELSVLPGTPFSYWISRNVRRLFSTELSLENSGVTVAVGCATSDNDRFARLRWEISPGNLRWIPYPKGGGYAKFHQDIYLFVDWEKNGAAIKSQVAERYGSASRFVQNTALYLRPGLTYPRVSIKGFGVRVLPSGCIFSDVGQGIFSSEIDNWLLLGLLNSQVVEFLMRSLTPSRKWEAGFLKQIPLPRLDEMNGQIIEKAAHQLHEITVKRDFLDETTGRFWGIPFPCGKHLKEWMQKEIQEAIVTTDSYESIMHGLNIAALKAYGLSESDTRIAAFMGDDNETDALSNADDDDAGGDLVLVPSAAEYFSYFVGISFGRWNIRHAIGEQVASDYSDPFAMLPVCPPGQLGDSQGLPASAKDVPPEYPITIPWDGILVDDPYHSLDLEHRIGEVITVLSGQENRTTADAFENEVCEVIGVQTLREYFRKPSGFFADHLRRYSKSRRQAPIYWQLSAGNGSYSAWLYYHRFTQDTLYLVLGDCVEPRIQEAEREQFELESQGGLSGDAASLLQEAQALLQDLQLFKSELELVAPLWNPNLNDGVIINHAILWRITPYTPWQKRCKECWDKLVKGDYDWAHLAFHLWPERVIRKCITDRSLAIAHGLEERLWQETNNSNWLARQTSEAELQALIAEHSKPAVQNALERFLAASPPVAAARTRAPRAAKSTSTSTTRRPRGSAPEVDAETSRQTLLVLTAAPADGLGRNAIAELLAVEAASLTAVIKQLKESGQIEQLGAARGAKYRLSESGLASVESQAGDKD